MKNKYFLHEKEIFHYFDSISFIQFLVKYLREFKKSSFRNTKKNLYLISMQRSNELAVL